MARNTSPSGRPLFTGVTTFTDAHGRYEFRHPSDWFRADLENGDGVIVGPDRGDDATHFAVAVADLGVSVVAADAEALRAGFGEGLNGLSSLDVQDARDDSYNDIVKLERTLTFSDGEATRKRRVWAMWADHWQFTVEFQGASEEEYAYWLPMGNYCFTSFTLPLALWHATDPEIRSPSTT